MHIRPKAWARPELLACGFFEPEAVSRQGHWAEFFPQDQPLHVELGCGKGHFLAGMGPAHPEVNYLGIDMIDAMLGLAKRNIAAAHGETLPPNVRLTVWDVTHLPQIFSPEDKLRRIYINFCNPWPRRGEHKKRMTHPRQLEVYEKLMAPGDELHFKTDCDYLFADSLKYFAARNWETVYLSKDLHAENPAENIMTEHERMYAAKGIKIKKVIVKNPAPEDRVVTDDKYYFYTNSDSSV